MTLLVLLSAGLIVTVALERQSAQSRIVLRQVQEYRRHHDMFGVRAIVKKWLSNLSRGDLAEMAEEDDVDHTFEMPGNVVVRLKVRDGQGTALRVPAGDDAQMRAYFGDVLDRIGPDPGFTRGAGPPQISVGGAPPEVLAAMIEEDGEDFAEDVVRARKRSGEIDRAEFARILSRATITAEQRGMINRAVTFESSLWSVQIETADWAGLRRFDMLVERSQVRTAIHEWFEYYGDEVRPLDAPDEDERRFVPAGE